MANNGNRMMEHHTRARITHDGPDAVALLSPIAMVAAAFAGRLGVHPAAAARAQEGIGLESCAFGTDGLPAQSMLGAAQGRMIAGAIPCDHLGHDALLT